MAKIKIDTSFVPKAVAKDKYWQKCIELAMNSNSTDQRYGAILVGSGLILGEGSNHQYHAEKTAILQAKDLFGAETLRGGTLYVAGFDVQARRPFVRKAGVEKTSTCISCTKLYVDYGLQAAGINEYGWRVYPGSVAHQDALELRKYMKDNHISKKAFRKSICL